MSLDTPTVYMPFISPPTPAPSPGPSAHIFPQISSVTASTFSTLPPAQRRQLLSDILAECSPDELLYISSHLSLRLRRDFLRELPPELALYTLSFIDEPTTLLRAGRVSRYWHNLTTDESLWKRLCIAYRIDAEEEWGREPDVSAPGPDLSLPSAGRHRARHSTGSILLTANIIPRRTYHQAFKLSYLNLRHWRNGGTLLRHFPLPSHPHHLPNDTLQPPAPTPTSAIPTSVALDSEWIVIGLANSRIHIFSARTGVSCRTLVGHNSGVWAVALVKGGGQPIDVPGQANPNSSPEPDTTAQAGPSTAEGLALHEHVLNPTLRGALGLDNATATPPKTFRRRSTPAVFRETAGAGASTSIPTPLAAPPDPGKPSDPAGTSEGWGQPNALVVSGGCDKDLRVWDVKSGYCIYRLAGHSSTIRCLKVLHNRPIAVSGSRDRTLRVWDIQRGRLLRVLAGHEDSVRTLDVCGNRVVSGSYDHTCRLWDVDTGQCLHVLRGHVHQIYTVSFDGVRIASGGMDTTVRVWDAETGACIALLHGHTALVCQVQLSPTMLVTGGSDGRVIVFSLRALSGSAQPGQRSAAVAPVQRLPAHDSSVTGLQLDSRFLVTGGNDGRVRLYQYTPAEGDNGSEMGRYDFVRDMCDPSESVWKVAYTRETCVIMYKRAGKTFVEIWSFRAKDKRV